VEPNYEKKLETFDELLNSDIFYGYHPAINYALDTISYTEFVNFVEHKERKEDCSNSWKCVERMITKRDIASVMSPVFSTYVAREMGTVDVGKVICCLDEGAITLSLTVLFKKGNPLLDRFNFLMRCYLEAGLMERLWTELQHRASLRGAGRFRDSVGDIFLAFSVSQLMPAFVVLLVGTGLSSMVFIAESILKCVCERRKKVFRALVE
jgi:hypothetical protein